jgi:hydrogenase maturation protease
MTHKTLVLGLGNTLLGDEGAGVHAVRYLRAACPDLGDVELLDGGTLSFVLAGPIAEADNLIVIDAAQLHSPPGTLRCYEGADMDRFVRDGRMRSVHEVSLSDLLVIAELSGELPRRRALIGIQPQHIDWSDALTEPVSKALPEACAQVRELLRRWRR